MINKRIPVQLISDYPVDNVLLATLNRFHFKTVHLDPETASPRRLKYVQTIPKPEDNEVFMLPAAKDISQAQKKGGKVVKRDYFTEISKHFHRYLKGTDQVSNKNLQSNEQAVPTADILADQFEMDLIEQFGLPRINSSKFAVAFTHDVDCVRSRLVRNLKSGLVFLFNSLRTINNPSLSLSYFKAALRFLLGQIDYYGFEQILEIAKRNNFKPVFFLFAKLAEGNGMNLWERSRSLNPSYDLRDKNLIRAFKALKEAGAEIGLHGSFKSANNQELLEAEKRYLEEVSGSKCRSIRQHYLKIYGAVTQEIYSKTALEVETTCGFVYENGYLCGTTRPFYSVLPDKEHNQVVVLPMVFMDAVPLYFRPKEVHEVFYQLQGILQQVRKFNGFVTFNFHQRIISCFPEYRKLYEDLAIEIKNMGGEIAATRELNRLFPADFPGKSWR